MTTAPPEINLLSQLLRTAELRHQVISQNIANVNTPGYQARTVRFEERLAAQLLAGRDLGDVQGEPLVERDTGLTLRSDGNNVDVDRESGRLHQNALLHQTYSQVLASYYDSLRRAMSSA